MKPRISKQRNHAMTLVEVLVVIMVLAVLMLLFFPWPEPTARKKYARINCVNNLRQIGLSYLEWSGDNNGKYPMQVSATNGGTMELISTGNVAACFQVMSNELSTPKLLICPADIEHIWATNFTTGFSAKNISYFVGLDASTNLPQAFLSGDGNFEFGGVPVKSGVSIFSSNAPIAWTAARHKFAGNIGLCDGSVQQITISGLTNLLQQTGLATNRLAIP
jgi:prepilin-type N-terminal cleavage/methylation domain-containing protein/prepilin-type processing-associated H-X9-DG protein